MGKGRGTGNGAGYRSDDRGTLEKMTVPAMPMLMAIICCVVNFILPGFGTIIAGFSLFCCGRTEGLQTESKLGGCCICFWIGIAQLIVAFLLIPCGWAWSIAWGIFFIGISSQYYKKDDPNQSPPQVADNIVHPTQAAVVVNLNPPPYQPTQGQPQQGADVYPTK